MTKLANFAISALLALAIAAPAAAHHVDTPETVSDADALTLYVAEYVAQKTPLVQAVQSYDGSPGALVTVRTAVDAAVDHMASLEVRECFRGLAEFIEAEFEAIVRAYQPDTNLAIRGLEVSHAGQIASGVKNEVIAAVIVCAPNA